MDLNYALISWWIRIRLNAMPASTRDTEIAAGAPGIC